MDRRDNAEVNQTDTLAFSVEAESHIWQSTDPMVAQSNTRSRSTGRDSDFTIMHLLEQSNNDHGTLYSNPWDGEISSSENTRPVPQDVPEEVHSLASSASWEDTPSERSHGYEFDGEQGPNPWYTEEQEIDVEDERASTNLPLEHSTDMNVIPVQSSDSFSPPPTSHNETQRTHVTRHHNLGPETARIISSSSVIENMPGRELSWMYRLCGRRKKE